MMPARGIPSHEELVEDLRRLRGPGLARLRQVAPHALYAAAAWGSLQAASPTGPGAPAAGAPILDADDLPRHAEALLRRAAESLGGDTLGTAALYTFGLAQGTRGWPAWDRRRRAAEEYRVSVERFRKHYEKVVMDQLAEAILDLCRRQKNPDAPFAAPSAPREPASPAEPRSDAPSEAVVDWSRTPAAVYEVPVGPHRVRIGVHMTPMELLRGVEVLVSPENSYLEVSKSFSQTVSGCLRRAAAVRSPVGEVIDDVVDRELAEWLRRNGRVGLPVQPGTVAPTSPGVLAERGVRWIFHAALAVPRVHGGDVEGGDVHGHDYDVEPTAIAAAVHNIFVLARAERATADPPLRSVAFPLLGAGRGGLAKKASLTWLWRSLSEELARDPSWDVHLVARAPQVGDLIARRLLDEGGTPVP